MTYNVFGGMLSLTQSIISLTKKLVKGFWTVASLGWVSPRAATEGVAPIFLLKKTDFFSHHRLPVLRCHRYLFSPEN